ncbi:metal transporter [Halieaceae bacterium IMCC14734]|uniref:Metal transporter n=1 Tax=Candidatus Litorirhabdus singularis TaxID=2518993 RepID=A0ABT3TFI9_9GAMM|nr:magnesium transporter CorA family protein [Candidatus Litorirhabdus singularis]MCX2980970.1 metal transporter [Candidatus Litorirhabdus singularis]
MIKSRLLAKDGTTQYGGAELITAWRASANSKLWLDIEGAMDPDTDALLQDMGCASLAIADCFRSRHPPKIETFAASTFILFRGISHLDEQLELIPQQIGLWVGDDFLISVHAGKSVSVERLWQEDSAGENLQHPGQLALKLLHFASGRYLEQLLEFEDRLAQLEDDLLEAATDDVMKELVSYRSRLRKLRRVFSYHKQLAESIWQTGSPHLGEGEDDNTHLRRDVYDRCERLYSLCNMYYELCGDLVEGYISLSSHKLNNTMKVLTIITAVFVPMGFLAGLYGMNFDNMPELHWEYSYFILLSVMATLALSMLMVFRRIRWL